MRNFDRSVSSEIKTANRTTTNFGNLRDKNQNMSMGESDAQKMFLQKTEMNHSKKDTLFFNSINQVNKHPVGYKLSIPLSYIQTGPNNMTSLQQTISQQQHHAYNTEGIMRPPLKTTKGGNSIPVSQENFKSKNQLGSDLINVRMRKDQKVSCLSKSNANATTVNNELLSSDSDSTEENNRSNDFFNTGHQRKPMQTHFMQNRKKQQSQGLNSQGNKVNIGSLVHVLHTSNHQSGSAAHTATTMNKDMAAATAQGKQGIFHHQSLACGQKNQIGKSSSSQTQMDGCIEQQPLTGKFSGGNYRPGGNLLMRSDAPKWTNTNPRSNSPIRPSTSTAGGTITARQSAAIPKIRQAGGPTRDNSGPATGGANNQILQRSSVQNGFVERENNLKQQVSNYYFQKEKPVTSPFASNVDTRATESYNSKTCINFNLRKGQQSCNNVAPDINKAPTTNGFFGQIKKNKSNDLEQTFNDKISSSHAFNSNSNNMFSNGQLKIDKGEKVQIAKLLKGGNQQVQEGMANYCTHGGDNQKDQVQFQYNCNDTASVELVGDPTPTNKSPVPKLIHVQSGSYGFQDANKNMNKGQIQNKNTRLNKRSDNAVSQSPVSLRDVIGAQSNDNVIFGTFLDQRNRSSQIEPHYKSVQTAVYTHQKDGAYRLAQNSGLSSHQRAITAENVNRNRLVQISKPNKDSMKLQRNNNYVSSNLSQNNSKSAGPANTNSNLITTSNNMASHFTKQRLLEAGGANSSQGCTKEQLKNLFAYSQTQTNMHMYQDLSLKKNSSSTSELLNTSSNSHKNTQRVLKDSAQLANEYSARDVNFQKDSVLKTNLLKKMKAEGGAIASSLRQGLSIQGENKGINSTDMRKLEQFTHLNKTQQNFKGNKASVKQLRERESSNQNTLKPPPDSKNTSNIQNEQKVNEKDGQNEGNQEQSDNKKSQIDSQQVKEIDKKEILNQNKTAGNHNKSSARKALSKDYECSQKSGNKQNFGSKSLPEHNPLAQKPPTHKHNPTSPNPSSQPMSTSLPPRHSPSQKPVPTTTMPDPFQIHHQPNQPTHHGHHPSSPHPPVFKCGPGENPFLLKDKKDEQDKDDLGLMGPHTDTFYNRRLRHGTDRSLNRMGNPEGMLGAASGKNERMASDCNRIMQRNQINIFKNSRDSLQNLGPDKAGEGVSILQNYEFSTPNCSKIDDYTFGQLIGRGAYAEVKESLHRKTGERVAIKQYDRYKLLDVQRKKQAIREIKILSRLDHPNIIKLHESIDTAKYVYLVMEYANGESLHTHLKSQSYRQFREEKAKRIIKQLLLSLEYIHDRNTTHRDIKLENIIIDRQEMIKLIDFGFCCSSPPETKLKIFCGTPSYMAPEIVQRRDYLGPPTDIWATGILFYAMLCGRFPFKGKDTKDLYKQIARGSYIFPDQTDLPEDFRISAEARHFCQKMLVLNPSARFSASKLVNDPYLRGIFTKKDRSLTSDGFLSTNESSNIISQTLAAGGNIGHITNSGSVGKSNKIRAWQQYENKVMINISGSSGEKMNIAPQMHTTLNNLQRPITQSKNLNQLYGQRETLHQFKRTIFTNKAGVAHPQVPVANPPDDSKQSILSQKKAALLNANRGAIQTAGSLTQGSGGGGVATNDRGRIPIEIKKPNISDIKRKE